MGFLAECLSKKEKHGKLIAGIPASEQSTPAGHDNVVAWHVLAPVLKEYCIRPS